MPGWREILGLKPRSTPFGIDALKKKHLTGNAQYAEKVLLPGNGKTPPTEIVKYSPIPKLSINKAGAGQYGYVLANTGNRNIRAEVFEQKFVRRIYTTFYNAISGGEQIRLDSYEEKLNSAVSKEEAILYYDELIAVMNMLILYAMYFSVSQDVRRKLDTIVHERNRALILEVRSELFRKGNFKSETESAFVFALSTTIVSGGAIAIALVGDSLGGLGLFTSLAVTAIFFNTYFVRNLKGTELAEESAVEKANTMGTVIQEIHRILFAEREYMFKDLVQEEKIKFWGMSEAQVNLLMDKGSRLTAETLQNYFTEFFTHLGKKQDPKDNKPFSPEVMKVQLRLTNTNLSQLSNENRRTYEYESVYGPPEPEAYANVNLPPVTGNGNSTPATGKVNLIDEAYANLKGGRRTRRRNTRRRKSVRRR